MTSAAPMAAKALARRSGLAHFAARAKARAAVVAASGSGERAAVTPSARTARPHQSPPAATSVHAPAAERRLWHEPSSCTASFTSDR